MKYLDPDTRDTTYLFFSGDNYQPTFINSKHDTIDPGFSIESVLFKNEAGSRLNGWFMKSRKEMNPEITLLHIHGNGGWLLEQYGLLAPLLDKGFQVFVFDYSGYGLSEGQPTQKNILLDALAAVDYIKSREDVKNTKLVLYGQSLGGHLSAIIAETKENIIDGLVMEGAFSSPKDIGADYARNIFLPGFIGRLLVKTNYSAKVAIKNYHKPLLVIHSSEDDVIPIKMGKKIFSNGNEPKQFYEIKGPHVYAAILYTDTVAEKIKKMVNR